MQFYRPRKTIPAIPIVSLIDILVILLIFFIVTMQPKKKRTIMDIAMPNVGEPLTTQEIVEARSVLAMSREGEITLNGVRVHQELLVDYLTTLKEENPQGKLELELDKLVSLEQMIMISTALTKSGYEANLPTRVRNTQPKKDS